MGALRVRHGKELVIAHVCSITECVPPGVFGINEDV